MQPVTTCTSEQPTAGVVGLPTPYRARAWWGQQLVAESTAAVRVEEPGQPPALCFPAADVRFDLFRVGAQVSCPVKGGADLWTIDRSDAGVEGGDVLWRFTSPPADAEWLGDLAAFDHDRVRVELVAEPVEGDPTGEVVTRFPNWGDVSDMVDLLDLRQLDERSYQSDPRADLNRQVVEGSQMLGQAIVAAGRHAPGRRVVSAHMVFMRPADGSQPLRFDLDEQSAGRTFTTLIVQVSQRGRRCATGTLLLDVGSDDIIRHHSEPPDVCGPAQTDSYDMSVTGRDVRIVDDAYTNDPDAPVGPPVLDAWVRYRNVPQDADIHAGLLAQFTGHLSIAAALRPHEGIGQAQAHRTLSTAINVITLSLHAEIEADHWLLYHHLSSFAGDGMTHSECRVHDEAGALVASFTVEAMVRPFAGAAPADYRTAL